MQRKEKVKKRTRKPTMKAHPVISLTGAISGTTATIMYWISYSKLDDLHKKYLPFPVDEIRWLILFSAIASLLTGIGTAVWVYAEPRIKPSPNNVFRVFFFLLLISFALFVFVAGFFMAAICVATKWAEIQILDSVLSTPHNSTISSIVSTETTHNIDTMHSIRSFWYVAIATSTLTLSCYIYHIVFASQPESVKSSENVSMQDHGRRKKRNHLLYSKMNILFSR